MALLPPQFLNSVVAIGIIIDDATATQWIGTGFIFGVEVATPENGIAPFLVTNQHILENDEIIVVKMNSSDELSANEYEFDTANGRHIITVHPEGLDVAVLPLPGNIMNADKADAYPLAAEHLLSIESAGNVGVSEGDGIFAIGFPMALVGYEDQIFPIVKQGCIARIQDWLSGRARHILIDANLFPGNSGGPVFLRPSLAAIEGTQSNPNSYLIGMVSAYIPYEDVAVSQQTGRERITFEENSGIVEIVPSDAIMETVQIAMQRLGLADERSG